MMRHKNITVAIIAAAILIAAAVMVTGRFVKASNESRDYDLASPALYVSRPEEGITGIIRDWRDTARLGPPFAQAVASLPDALVSACRPSESHPVLITYYRDGSLAFWAAARNSSIQRLVASLAHDLSDGYSPVEERRPDGTHLYHFATADNRFAHLYHNHSVVGYSYRRELLTSPAYDGVLARAIEENTVTTMPAIIYHDTAYRTFYVKQSATHITYRCALQALPGYLTGKTDSLQTDAIPASACEIMQALCITAPFIREVVTRVVLADDTAAAAVIAAPITDPRTLGKTLRPYMTPYGYRIPADSLAHILPASWLGNADYWIEVHGTTLLASTEAQTLRRYVQALRQPQRFSPTTPPAPALVTYISTDSSANKGYDMLIPSLKLPPFLASEPLMVQIVAERAQRYGIEITVPSYPCNRSTANR